MSDNASADPRMEDDLVVNIKLLQLQYGFKIKNHCSVVVNQDLTLDTSKAVSPMLFFLGGEDNMTGERIEYLYMLNLEYGYIKSVHVCNNGYVSPFYGGALFPIFKPSESLASTKNLQLVSFGGVDTDEILLEPFFVFDLNKLAWESKVKMMGSWEVPTKRKGHSYVTIGNKHYFFGGQLAEEEYERDVYVYDLETNYFSFVYSKAEPNNPDAVVPPPSIFHASCAYKDHVLIYGGNTIDEKVNELIYRFDTVRKVWTSPISVPADLFPTGISHHKMCTIGDILVIVGGMEAVLGDYANQDTNELRNSVVFFDLKRGIQIKNIKLNGELGARVGHTLHAINNQLWIVGGDSSNISDSDIAVLTADFLSEQPNVTPRPLNLLLNTSPLDTNRQPFPPPKSAFDSVIIGSRDGFMLNKWYGDRRQKWQLLYRGSRDGFSSTAWHSKVDNQGPTISIVRAHGYIFGGFTPIAWNSSGADQYDDDSWIFSLKNPHDNNQYKFPKIPNKQKRMRSVYHASGYGLWFGANDILIYSNADCNYSSNACLGKSYEYNLSYDPNTFFCGQSAFMIEELETFGRK